MTNDLYMLQTKLIYAMVVVGKSARFANLACHRFLRSLPLDKQPLTWIREMMPGELEGRLREARTGKYEKLCQGLQELTEAGLNLRTCKPEDLEKIHGIGPKTARFWLLWTRPKAHYAVLDMRILRWLKKQGHDTPATTPSSENNYAQLEKVFLAEANKCGKTPRELSTNIWKTGSIAVNAPGGT